MAAVVSVTREGIIEQASATCTYCNTKILIKCKNRIHKIFYRIFGESLQVTNL
jgi:DNA-directed RNA polymerase subunit RPC12/RpoP